MKNFKKVLHRSWIILQDFKNLLINFQKVSQQFQKSVAIILKLLLDDTEGTASRIKSAFHPIPCLTSDCIKLFVNKLYEIFNFFHN
jgi:hypothetical protein